LEKQNRENKSGQSRQGFLTTAETGVQKLRAAHGEEETGRRVRGLIRGTGKRPKNIREPGDEVGRRSKGRTRGKDTWGQTG